MTDDGFARIKSLRLELTADSELARGLLARSSRLYHQSLKGGLSALLNRMGADRQWVLPKLTLNLGVIQGARFESEFTRRLLTELETELAAIERTASGAAGGVSTGEVLMRMTPRQNAVMNSRGQNSSGQYGPDTSSCATAADYVFERGHKAATTFPGAVCSLPEGYSSSPLMLLQQYLVSGYAAPQLREALASGADTWLQAQLSMEPAAWRSVLARLCLQPSALARLLTTFAPQGLSAIACIGLDVELRTPPSGPAAWAAVLMLGALQHHSPPLQLSDIAAWQHLAAIWPGHSVRVIDAPSVLRQATLVNLLHQPSPSQAVWLRLLGTLPNVCSWLNTWNGAACEAFLPLESEALQAATRYPPPQTAPGQPAEPLQVDNAGVLLLWPLLPGLFRRWGLLEEGSFIDASAQTQAVCWLDAWLWQDESPAEWRTPLTKVLCGWPIAAPFHSCADLAPDACTDLDALLRDLPAQIPGLHGCSAQDLRHWFLQRPGLLRWQEGRWQLQVEADACDVLLSALPWPINQPRLPWLAAPIDVKWF